MPLVFSIKRDRGFVIEGGIRVTLHGEDQWGGTKVIVDAPRELAVERDDIKSARRLDDRGRLINGRSRREEAHTDQSLVTSTPTVAMLAAALLLLLGSGCAATPPPRAALPTWIEAAQFIPASESIPPGLPVPAGWTVHPHTVVQSAPHPYGITNEAGALISWVGTLRCEAAPGIYRVEYLAHEFSAAFVRLFDITHTGPPGETFIPITWTQPSAPEFRLLKQTP